MHRSAHGIGQHETQVAEHRAVEGFQGFASIRVVPRFHLAEHIRMATNQPLAKDDQAAGHDVRAFHGDRNRALLVSASQEIVWPHADAFAGHDVHAVVDDHPRALGDVVLGNRRDHRGLFTGIQRRHRDLAHRIAGIQMPGHARQGRLYAFELADGQAELLAHRRISRGATYRDLAQADVGRRQRNGAPGCQTFHQHAPAIADLFAAADHPFQRNKHILAGGRPVLEHRVQRPMPTTAVHARVGGGDQRTGNAQRTSLAEQAIRVFGTKRQAQHRGNRAEGDVALVPGHFETQHFLALMHAFADDAQVWNRPGIGTGIRAGEGKARDVFAACQARQIVIALRIGAVMQQQFSRAKGVGHHHRNRRGRATRRQLHHHLRMRIVGEAFAAVLLGNDHAQEPGVLGVLPAFGGHVLPDLGGFPVVGDVAEGFHFVIEKRLLFGAQAGRRGLQQALPVGLAAEQLGVPPHGAGLDGRALGVRHRRHDRAKQAQGLAGQQRAAQRLDRHQHGGQYHQNGRDAGAKACDHIEQITKRQPDQADAQPQGSSGLSIGQGNRGGDTQQ